ncbi:MAG TPA: PQQ-binding-like beta-propeller repeat protein [Steroidobacteraceae bacterium]
MLRLIAVLAFVGVFSDADALGQNPAAAPSPLPAEQVETPTSPRGPPGTESGIALFEKKCTICHGNPAVEHAPSPDTIRAMSPEKIYAALAPTGIMAAQGAMLKDQERRAIAEFMSGRPLGSSRSGAAGSMPNQCRSNPELPNPDSAPQWNGWGSDGANRRFQTAAKAGIGARDVPRLKLKWAFGYAAGVSANAQPTIVSGRVFVGSDNGFFYSLDAKSGCVYWSFDTGSIVRGAATLGPIRGNAARYAVYFGDGRANVYALDAHSGSLLWKTKVDQHFVARITAGTRLDGNKLLVPVSSSEGYSAGSPDYPCCTSRGSVVALDSGTGRQIWKAWVITEEPKLYTTQANGVPLYGPAGGPVWNTPTVDDKRRAIYFGTGDASAAPAPATTDSIMAVDIDSGRKLWAYQTTAGDVYLGGCEGSVRSDACPKINGPDMDIGNSPILLTLPNGKRLLLAGTKAADIIAVDPDNNGALIYRVNPTGAAPGGVWKAGAPAILWGGAADTAQAYYGMGTGGLAAIDPASGRTLWIFKPKTPEGSDTVSLGAAPTVIPGVVFEGSNQGTLYAVSAADGKELWRFDTARSFAAVNKVAAHGGAIATSGAVAVDGMLFVGSGYAVGSGATAGNLLLAFTVH